MKILKEILLFALFILSWVGAATILVAFKAHHGVLPYVVGFILGVAYMAIRMFLEEKYND